jgi:hypothetical protein
MSDGLSDGRNCTLINFIVSCPQGTMFFISVDAFDGVKDANLLFELLDEVFMEMGVANVIQVITDNASNYVLGGEDVIGETQNHILDHTSCLRTLQNRNGSKTL